MSPPAAATISVQPGPQIEFLRISVYGDTAGAGEPSD
jgi:hypothetical protein